MNKKLFNDRDMNTIQREESNEYRDINTIKREESNEYRENIFPQLIARKRPNDIDYNQGKQSSGIFQVESAQTERNYGYERPAVQQEYYDNYKNREKFTSPNSILASSLKSLYR